VRFTSLAMLITVFCLSNRTGVAQLATTPPMGWNSWNHFENKISDADIRATADALVATGLRDSGYVYVNIDDGWQGKRTESGALPPNERFPDMKALADYVHARGLKLGIYSSPGRLTCAGNEGSMGHEQEDAKAFAKWGVDYLKYDICSYRKVIEQDAHGDPELARQMMFAVFDKMHSALQATGRPIVYSVSQHGLSRGWTWANQAGANLWRTGDDVRNNYLSVTEIGFSQGGLSQFAGPGHWNDPDMLEIGNGVLSSDEGRTQLSLWSLLAAPLLAAMTCRRWIPTPWPFSITARCWRSIRTSKGDKGTEYGPRGHWRFGCENSQADRLPLASSTAIRGRSTFLSTLSCSD
jgi:alpha-galactosidase